MGRARIIVVSAFVIAFAALPATTVLAGGTTHVSITITSNKDFQEAVREGINYQSLLQLAGKGSVQAAGIMCMKARCSEPSRRRCTGSVGSSASPVIRCGTALQPTCWKWVRTSGPYRSFWATTTCGRP